MSDVSRAHIRGDAAASGAGGYVGGEDVVRVPVEVLACSVIARCRAGIGVPGGDLDIAQVNPEQYARRALTWALVRCGLVSVQPPRRATAAAAEIATNSHLAASPGKGFSLAAAVRAGRDRGHRWPPRSAAAQARTARRRGERTDGPGMSGSMASCDTAGLAAT